jgi:RNA-binding motif X-linked protein 2
MNVIEEIKRINHLELEKGIVNTSASWHQKYNQSAWVYCGNLPTQLSEGDVICIMSQYGEVEDLNLVREEDSGKSKGFCFCKYEDQRSTVLAVDNLTGAKILGRSIRVDHVEQYRLPKELLEKEEAERNLGPGHAYDGVDLKNHYNIHQGQDLFGGPPLPAGSDRNVEQNDEERRLARKKRKEERSLQRREREKRREEKEERKREQRAQQMRSGHKVKEEEDMGESKFEKKSERDTVQGGAREHKKQRHHRKEDRSEKKKRRNNDDEKGSNPMGRTSQRKRRAREDDTDEEREQSKSRHDSD